MTPNFEAPGVAQGIEATIEAAEIAIDPFRFFEWLRCDRSPSHGSDSKAAASSPLAFFISLLRSSHNGASISAHYYNGFNATPGVPANGTNKYLVNLEDFQPDTQTAPPGCDRCRR